jgi:sortase A
LDAAERRTEVTQVAIEGEEAEGAAEGLAGVAELPVPLPPASAQPSSPKPVLPRPARAPLPAAFFVAISVLLSVSGLALWGAFYTLVLGSVQEHRSQHLLNATFRGQYAEGTVPTGGRIAHGAAVAMLQVPRLGARHLMVVEGTTSRDLEAGPGHRRDTPLPGQEGTSYIMGRSRTFGAPFARLGALKKGDPITVQTGEGTFTYNVDAVRRPGDSLTPFDAGTARLTLVTSESIKGRARQVLYVDATLKGKALPPSTGRPSSIPVAEKQLQGDRRALIAVVAWLAALLLVAAVGSWGRSRWGRRQAVLVGLPVLVASLWGVAEAATHLLPNLF